MREYQYHNQISIVMKIEFYPEIINSIFNPDHQNQE